MKKHFFVAEMKLYHPILMVLWQLGSHERKDCRFSKETVSCKRIQQEDFIYGVYRNEAYLKKDQMYSIKIVDSNFSFIEFFPDLNQYFGLNIYRLEIRKSSIRRIHKNAFQNLGRLQILDLGNNFIEDITFIENIVSNLQTLNLENNIIRILDLNVFSSARYLNTIIMRGNNIREITALENFKRFTFMDLSFNQIAAFNETTLNCFFSSINLSYNKLQNINILDTRFDNRYGYLKKVVVNLTKNNITSLGSYEKESFSVDELYLTSVPTELPTEFHLTVFSLANSKFEQLNKSLFNINIIKTRFSVIDFSNSSVTKFSESYFKDVHLSLLNLSHNYMSVMNENIFNNSIVSHLDLSFCNARNISVNFFEGLQNCEIVNLTGNRLESVEDICKFVEFSTIDLSHNGIKRIGVNAFKNCKRLEVLVISNSGIEYIEPNAFDSLKYYLIHLDLSNNNISNLKQNFFIDFTKIRTIDLSSNMLEVLETNKFYNSSVRDIQLWNTSIKYIQNRAFNSLYNLRSLNLSNSGMMFLESEAFFNLPKLEIIDLRLYNLEELHFNDSEIVSYEAGALNGLFRLKQLDAAIFFHKNSIMVKDSFSDLHSLRTLRISNSNLTKIQAGAFSGLANLNLLDLSHNSIYSIDLDDILVETKSLKTLILSFNQLITFNITIDQNSSLETLLLDNNNIFSVSASTQGLVELKTLHLQNNNLNRFPFGMFRNFRNLEELRLDENQLKSLNTFNPDVFGGLNNLRILNVSGNHELLNFNVLLFPSPSKSSRLQTIILDKTDLQDGFDYKSLKEDNPLLHIGIFRKMKLFHSILMVLCQLGSYQGQVCQFSTWTFFCKRIQQEDFMYQVYKNEPLLKNNQVFYVEIVDSNFSFIEDFIDLDPYFGIWNIYTLKIRSSSIRRIGQNAFQNLKNLVDLDLGGNFIEDIGFIENIVSNLRYLNLEYNRIRILDLNVFNYAWKLNSIIMRGNNIRKITALNSFKKFTFMDLSFNQITAFNETALNCFFSSINLSFNKLQNINILDKTYINSYRNSKKIVNLSGNNITSLGSYERTSFSCDELYLTSVPTELPNEFHITKVFSLANTKTEQWNRTLFNIDIVKFGPSPVIDFSNSSITKFSESYFRDVHSSLLNLSHNDMTVMNKSIFNNSFVNHLDLSFSNVKNFSVNFFEGLKNCGIVNLTGNHLESIHDICKFVEFSSIDLSHNRIKRIGVNAFKNCNRLYELKLSNSGIEYIEPNSFNGSKSSLVHLDLSKNNLINLKENSFVNLTSIETIDLSSNNLGVLETNMFYNLSVMDIKLWNTSIKYIQNRAFNNLYNLQSLNLSNIGITFMEPNAFFNLPSLDTIDLRKNNFATIESNTFDIPMKTLLLNGNGIKHIKSGSFENLSLNALNLSNLGIQKLEPFSFSGLSYLSVLDLRDNNITEIQKNVFFNLTIGRFLLENNNISKIWGLDNSVRVNELSLSFSGVLEPQTISNINLKKLLLVNSSIESLKTNCFLGLHNLEELHFIDSDIGSYEPGALNGLFQLKNLDASNILKKTNKLFGNLFSDLLSLRTLRISNINLTEIRVGAFSGSNLKEFT
ncbi:hypothetical protein JTB14_030978 [Gonioctena quinquepunctata]|nr:hypothetical protein JTB14_030978 [Gonioctena quinquepunctata]